jgi:hypothetical protein
MRSSTASWPLLGTGEGVTDMWALISVRLAKWHAAFITGVTAMIARLLGPLLPPVAIAAREAAIHSSGTRPGHHHTAEEHAVPGWWMMAPRVSTAVWLIGAVVALAHHVHVSGRADSVVEIRQLGGGR